MRSTMSAETPAAGSSRAASTSEHSQAQADPRFSFPPAFQPSIIRSFQKDSYYLFLLQSQLSEAVRTIFGSRYLQLHSESVSALAGVAYYVFTTWDGAQTLGEEYVGSRMVGNVSGRYVSRRKRLLFIFTQILAPFLLGRLYAKLRRRVIASNSVRTQALQRAQLRWRAVRTNASNPGVKPEGESQEPSASAMDRVVATISRWLPSKDELCKTDGWLAYASAVHLMLFYLGGKFYRFGQRFAGVKYVSGRIQFHLDSLGSYCAHQLITHSTYCCTHSQISIHPSPPGQRPPSYEVLGILLAIQLGLKLSASLNRFLHTRAASKAGEKGEDVPETAKGQDDGATVEVDGRRWSHATTPPRPVGLGEYNTTEGKRWYALQSTHSSLASAR